MTTTMGGGQEVEGRVDRAEEAERYLLAAANLIVTHIHDAEDPSKQSPAAPRVSRDTALELPEYGLQFDEIQNKMATALQLSANPWTGRFVDKLYSAPLPIGIASEALLAAINANAHVFSAAPMLCLAEEACVAGLAELCEWDTRRADGLTMPGGSASNTFAIQTALMHRFARFKDEGVAGVVEEIAAKYNRPLAASRPLIFTGKDGHYSIEKAAMACGLGLKSVVKVECNADGTMNVDALRQALQSNSANGLPLFVNATSGSTVLGSFDDLAGIANVCKEHAVWLHCDGSRGAPVLFSRRHRLRMHGIAAFDSLTINPHKLLNVPHQCSFVVFQYGDVLSGNALDAPYLFHNNNDSSSDRHAQRRKNPAMMTFACGRKGDAFKFYFAWLQFGSHGFGEHVDRGVELAIQLTRIVKQRYAETIELYADADERRQFLQVCLRPRIAHDATSDLRSRATRFVHARLQDGEMFAVDYAPLGEQGDFIRIVTHPTCGLSNLELLVEEIARIGKEFTLRS